MKYIFCYGDSNTWGFVPITRKRYDFNVRWPGIMQKALGEEYHIYENALNGRTTVFDDPIEEGRCGKTGFDITLEVYSPLDLVVIMLGTNDVKPRFHMPAFDIGKGIELLIKYIKRVDCGWNGATPQVLIVSPIVLGAKWENSLLRAYGLESTQKSKELAEMYRYFAELNGANFMDAKDYAKPSVDCVHLDEENHRLLGLAIADKVKRILG